MVTTFRSEAGFTLAEMLVAIGIMLVVSSIVTSALLQMTNHQQTVWNRTEMHSGVRGATELLQQEVGQAGRITLPGTVPVVLSAAVAGGPVGAVPCTSIIAAVNSTAGMFQTEILSVLDGDNQESVSITAPVTSATQFTACFTRPHGIGAVLLPLGGFATGIVPPNPPSVLLNGSTANKLKLYGDINGDGSMVYIEYYCDNGDAGTAGSFNLYRNVMPIATLVVDKPVLNNSMILLSNVHPNPMDGLVARPCFQYQTSTVSVTGLDGVTTLYTFVLDVAVTLTVWSQDVDPTTRQFQTETKALLNVSPRNVFASWQFAGMGYTNRIQPTPASVIALLP